ncbi:MAG TPA: mannose-1-phosphate guanylyltransferase/mannose-6-phosphate isomerase [Gammaproteobacteria bacterium]
MLVPVILSGGRGTRLWPVSREARPKPFLKIAHGRSLLQATLLRAAAVRPESILIATNDDYYFQTEEEIAAISNDLAGADIHYLLEPQPRGTAPAIRMAARYARERHGENALLLVLPSDHLINNDVAFQRTVDQAVRTAQNGVLVTLGIQPAGPETAFGYIECGEGRIGPAAQTVRRFIEKPRREDAEILLTMPDYVWNAGIFCFSVKSIETAFARHAPEIDALVEATWQNSRPLVNASNVVRLGAAAFAGMPDTSIDCAIFEKADNVAVVRTDMDWCDIGSWESVTRLTAPDAAGNKVLGQAVLINARNNYVQTDGRLVAAVGVNGLVIVDTPDALLVGAEGDLQEVGRVADRLRVNGHDTGFVHRNVHRPWGTYTVLAEDEYHKIKRLRVKPGGALSLQMHRFRTEHWVVVQGVAQVTCDDRIFELVRHQSTVVPPGCVHRIENHGSDDVVIIETQTGSYLGEDDIIRIQDDYGRTEH